MTEPGLLRCEHATRCPGCALIDLPLAAQLAAKASASRARLRRFPSSARCEPSPCVPPSPVADYRTRAKLAVAPGRASASTRAARHDVLDLPGCRVLAPAIAADVAALRRLLAAPPPGTEPVLRAEGDGSGRLRAVDLREVRDARGAGVLLTLVLRAPSPSQRALDAACEALHRGASVAARDRGVAARRSLAAAARRGAARRCAARRCTATRSEPVRRGRSSRRAPSRRRTARRRPRSTPRSSVRSASSTVCACSTSSPAAARSALALAARGAQVTAIESFAPAARAAARAAREQDLARARGGAPASPRNGKCRDSPRRVRASTLVIVNPPRRGVAPRVRARARRLCDGPLVYVSCEPATLARDLAHLAQLGLAAERIVPFDLMPQTAEVECVALLRRGAIPELELLYEDEAILAVDKPPFLATVPHAERAGSLQRRVRARRGAEQAVALHHLDADASGVCLFAKREAIATGWRGVLGDTRTLMRWVALVRSVAQEQGRIASPLREDGHDLAAATRYRRVEVLAGHALLDVTPETRRTHQICRHLASIGAAVLGDDRYGHAASNRHLFERHFLDRPFLHCASIELRHPGSGATLRLEAPLAPDLAAVLARLRALDPKA